MAATLVHLLLVRLLRARPFALDLQIASPNKFNCSAPHAPTTVSSPTYISQMLCLGP